MQQSLIQFSTDDLRSPEGTERVLRQFNTAMFRLTTGAALPSLRALVTQLAPLIRDQLQANGAYPLNLQSLLPTIATSSVPFNEDNHVNRGLLYTPPIIQGSAYFETDRTVLYASILNGGSLAWRYVAGEFVSTFASRPTDLGTLDSGFLFYATDQDTVYIWTGAAWDTISRRILLGGFFAIFTHANTADRTYTLVNASGTLAIYPIALATDVSGVLPVANGGTGISYDRIAQTLSLTAQVAAVGATNFTGVVTPGTYRVSYSLLDTSADLTAGTIQFQVNFTDAAGATNVTSAALALTALGRTSGVFFLQATSGNVSYQTNLVGIIGAATYALYVCFERLS